MVLVENASAMFLQNSVAGAQAKRASVLSQALLRAGCEWLGENLKHTEARVQFGTDVEHASAMFRQYVQTVREQLQTNLKQLIRIADNLRHPAGELRANLNARVFTLRLSQLYSRSQESIQIDR